MKFIDRIFKYGLERRQLPFIDLETFNLGNGKWLLHFEEQCFFRQLLDFGLLSLSMLNCI